MHKLFSGLQFLHKLQKDSSADNIFIYIYIDGTFTSVLSCDVFCTRFEVKFIIMDNGQSQFFGFKSSISRMQVAAVTKAGLTAVTDTAKLKLLILHLNKVIGKSAKDYAYQEE